VPFDVVAGEVEDVRHRVPDDRVARPADVDRTRRVRGGVLDDDGLLARVEPAERLVLARFERRVEVRLPGVEVDVRAPGLDAADVGEPREVDGVGDLARDLRRGRPGLARQPERHAGGEHGGDVRRRLFDAEVVGGVAGPGERLGECARDLVAEGGEHGRGFPWGD